MIPRVRLLYVQGLAAAHEELHAPREVDLTTDGERLVVASPRSGRPLAKLPLDAVERVAAEPGDELVAGRNREFAALVPGEPVVTLRVRAGAGVPAALAAEPLVFVAPDHSAPAAQIGRVQQVLVPRSREQMVRLEQGERRLSAYYAVGLVAAAILLLAIFVALWIAFAAPRPREQGLPAPGVALASGASPAAAS